MHRLLSEREARGESIRVALVGAGRMGLGIASQIARTPGMELITIADVDLEAARRAALVHGRSFEPMAKAGCSPPPGTLAIMNDPRLALDPSLEIDVLVEASSAIADAAHTCELAIERGAHVVLMNAEVDLAHGSRLLRLAKERGVVLTSDAGDQHGVLLTMIDEIRLWGIEIVMAGNMKGFLNRYATAEGIVEEARIRRLDPHQCCAYTDGTKLNIEMALVANATGLHLSRRGMDGPRIEHVDEVLDTFDFDRYQSPGVVDYVLGAKPDGGVFVVGHCEDPLQREFLHYYKRGEGPYYLFYRPYHLCHLETPRAIAKAACYGEAVLAPWAGKITDVYAHAKRDLVPGEEVAHAIGGDQFYGLIEEVKKAEDEGLVPLTWLEPDGEGRASLHEALMRDEPLRRHQVDRGAFS